MHRWAETSVRQRITLHEGSHSHLRVSIHSGRRFYDQVRALRGVPARSTSPQTGGRRPDGCVAPPHTGTRETGIQNQRTVGSPVLVLEKKSSFKRKNINYRANDWSHPSQRTPTTARTLEPPPNKSAAALHGNTSETQKNSPGLFSVSIFVSLCYLLTSALIWLSPSTMTPFLRRSWAATPSPGMSRDEKLPS